MVTPSNKEEDKKTEIIDAHPDEIEVVPFGLSTKKKEEIEALDLTEGVIKGKQITKYFVKIRIKTTAGDPTSRNEGEIVINKVDNTIKMYGDSGWRQLATW